MTKRFRDSNLQIRWEGK